MTPVDSDGVFCVVSSGEVEKKTAEGWRLVGVIESETLVPSYDMDAAPSFHNNQSGYTPALTVSTTHHHPIKSPTFLLRRSPESEMERLGLALLASQQEVAAVKKSLTETEEKLKSALNKDPELALEIDRLKRQLDDSKNQVKAAVAQRDASNDKVKQANDALAEANERYKKLEERLGKNSKPTAFERLLEDREEEPTL